MKRIWYLDVNDSSADLRYPIGNQACNSAEQKTSYTYPFPFPCLSSAIDIVDIISTKVPNVSQVRKPFLPSKSNSPKVVKLVYLP